jgi:hypothetical protein
MDAELEWTHNSPEEQAAALREFQSVLPDHLEAAADDIGEAIIREAQELVNVDTGELRDSLDWIAKRVVETEVKVIMGSDVEYAWFQEVGWPYLRPAIESQREYIQERVEQALEDARDEVTS